VQATLALGRLYEHGIGLEKNIKKAIFKYSEAAVKEDYYGYYMLGKVAEEGKALELGEEEKGLREAK
jgi:TPR repeat protein